MTEVLRGVPGVTAVSCALFDDGGRLGIAAFVAVAGALTAAQVQQAARLHLPATMMGDRIVVVETLPLTPAGKVDERRLLAGAGLTPRVAVGPYRSGTTGPLRASASPSS